jgi:anti-sigma regulatory factor (Ser/Thr protein kinase)
VNSTPCIHLFLGPDTRAPSRARRALRSELESVLEADLLERATLLVSELVTNSVRHGGLRPDQEIEVTVRASAQHLRVEVVEPGQGFEVVAAPDPRRDMPAGGWGLYLVDRLSSAWGVERNGVTKVWFEMGPLSS